MQVRIIVKKEIFNKLISILSALSINDFYVKTANNKLDKIIYINFSYKQVYKVINKLFILLTSKN